jgi:subfamily B ATP-binding cassette protein MsbA
LRTVWPLLKELVRPRRGLIALGFLLMVINRVCGMVLPVSTKFLVDNVISKQQHDLLGPLILGVFAATIIQGGTSFTLSVEGRAAVDRDAPESAGTRGPVAGSPVTTPRNPACWYRIMNDVKRIRNLIELVW